MKQAPRAWNRKIDSFFKYHGFKKYEMEYGVYVKHAFVSNVILVYVYVDDIFLIRNCTSEINKFKMVPMNAFDMNDLRNIIYFLGMDILSSKKGIIMHQMKYELELLKKFELINYKSAVTPAETNHKLDYDDDGDDVDAATFK